MLLALTVLAVFLLLISCEFWWRKRTLHSEFSRKFIHITVGSFVAFWPFFLRWREIELLSIAFLVVIFVSKRLHIFRAIHSVQRPTWGELFFAVAVGLAALITHDKWIYMTALLQMSLADGLAAVIGVRFGKKHRYSVFKHAKSVVGTLTFFIVSTILLLVYRAYGDPSMSLLLILALAFLASLIENIGIQGLDNLLVPVLIAFSLRFIA